MLERNAAFVAEVFYLKPSSKSGVQVVKKSLVCNGTTWSSLVCGESRGKYALFFEESTLYTRLSQTQSPKKHSTRFVGVASATTGNISGYT